MPRLNITNLTGGKSTLDAKSGDTLMEVLRDNGYDDIEAICGGVCSCSTCHVYIQGDWKSALNERSADEHQLVSSTENFQDNSRLACQITLTDDLDGLEIAIVKQSY